MKQFKKIIKAILFLPFAILVLAPACKPVKNVNSLRVPPYVPESQELYDEIVHMDSTLFDAYNSCNLEDFESIVSTDLEFYNDKGGLMTSKDELIQAIQINICGKVTRELLKGSIEVYPIPDFGAVQMGTHRFYNQQEKQAGPSPYSKFVHTWRKENGEWRLARVISLH